MSSFDEIDGVVYDAIVIGSGFGGSVASTRLVENGLRILVIERGTWWGNPEGPALPPQRQRPQPDLIGANQRQWWPRPNDSRGMVYTLQSVYKEINPIRDFFDPFVTDNDLGLRANRRGLYRVTRFTGEHGNVDVVSSNGVGGGSLLYSGVNLIPSKAVLERIGLGHLTSEDFRAAGTWMNTFRGRINKINTKVPVPHRAGTQYQLGAIPESGDPLPSTLNYEMPDSDLPAHEEDYLYLDRARVLKRARERVVASGGFVVDGPPAEAGDFKPLPLSVVEYDAAPGGDSDDKHAFCLREGRCLIGCLPSARHTLYKTLEKQKQVHPNLIEVLPQTKVSHLSRDTNGRYVVHVESFVDDDDGRRGMVYAPRVFLGAGVLGTTEILLRSKLMYDQTNGGEGLPLPESVGTKFSTDGDFFAFAKRVGETDDTTPDPQRIGKPNPTVGPINSSGFHLVFGRDSAQRLDIHIEDAGIPTMFARFVHEALPAFDGDVRALAELARAFVRTLMQKDPFDEAERPRTTDRNQEDYQTERELIGDLFFFNAMGSGPDEPSGTFYLDNNRSMQLRYDPDRPLASWSVFRHIETVLRQLAEKMNGEFIVSPFWRIEKRITVAHPLGGCPVGSDRTRGAVDRVGRVFDGSPGEAADAVLNGLYVVDAAAIPGALAVNPTFTIVTHALYVMRHALSSP